MPYFKRFLSLIFFIVIFGAVIYFIQPPKAWGEASIYQILIFFIPLLLLITSVINIFLDYFSKSFALGLGFMFMVVLWTVNELNFITVFATIIATLLLFISLPNYNRSRTKQGLTMDRNILKIFRSRRN